MLKKLSAALIAAACCVSMSLTAFAVTGYGNTVDAPDYVPGVENQAASAEKVEASAEKAVKDAQQSGSKATVQLKNAKSITPDAIKTIAAKASEAGVPAVIHADQVQDGKVVARWYIDPAAAQTISSDINLGVATTGDSVQEVAKLFETFYNNTVSVVHMEHRGSIGAAVEIAVKADITGLDKENLLLFVFDKQTNSYMPLEKASYFLDENGYLHFTTSVAGDIIITDQALTLK